MNKFWLMNTQGNKGKINIFGDISDYDWWQDETSPQSFLKDLENLGEVSEIDVYINSNGGSAMAGNAIYNMLSSHKAKINTYAVGIAASSASLIFMAGDNRYMYKSSFLMIHGPQAGVYGNAENLRQMADELDVIGDGVMTAYMKCGTLSEDEMKEIMSKDTWFTAEMAKEQGFATEILDSNIQMSLSDGILDINNTKFNMSGNKSFSDFIMKKGINLIKKEEEEEMEIKTIEDIQKNYPEMFKQIKEEGVQEERARMQQLDEISMAGAEEIIENAKYKEPKSVAEVSMEICKAMKTGQVSMTAQTKEEGKNETGLEKFNLKKVDAGEAGKVVTTTQMTAEEKIKSQADKIAMKLNGRRGL